MLFDHSGLCRVLFQPIESVGTEQDEMNQQCQYKQEREQSYQHSARIEQKPDSPHFLISSTNFRSDALGLKQLQPRAPLPNQNVRNDRNDRKHHEAGNENAVELFGLIFRQPR